MVMARIDVVSAAKTNRKAFLNDSFALTSGQVETEYPDRKDKIEARVIVCLACKPVWVPMVTPIISPMAQPAKQWSVALKAMFPAAPCDVCVFVDIGILAFWFCTRRPLQYAVRRVLVVRRSLFRVAFHRRCLAYPLHVSAYGSLG